MDLITGMQKAIDYIENNLTADLDYSEIAKKAYVSSFHFQRVFSIMCGYTIGEYIRNRRLTIAGSELSATNAKVIDIALKYGYDSPDGFAKAFSRFHGITPSSVRKTGAKLRSFSRLSIKVSLEGGNIMNYRIEEKESFKIIAKTKLFSVKDEINKIEIPKFWDKCHSDGTIQKLCNFAKDGKIFGQVILGICEENTCENASDFPYSIGAEYCGGDVPDGFIIKDVPQYTWVIFNCVGAMPHAIQIGWHKIYTEFFPTSEYQQIPSIDFEVYPDGDMDSKDYVSEIWIPVEKK